MTARGGFLVRVAIPCVGDWTPECLAAAVAAGRASDDDYGDSDIVGGVVTVELTWVEPTLKAAKKLQAAIAAATGRTVTIREQ